MESEKEQLQLSLESLKTHYKEEQTTMEKSHRYVTILDMISVTEHCMCMYIFDQYQSTVFGRGISTKRRKVSVQNIVVRIMCVADIRWKEELRIETSHHKERLEQLERDQTHSLLALRKKMESLEITKTNEIAQMQKTHRYHSIDNRFKISLVLDPL